MAVLANPSRDRHEAGTSDVRRPGQAVTAYRQIIRDARDPELVAAATGRVRQLEGRSR